MHFSAEFIKICEHCGNKCIFSECQTQKFTFVLFSQLLLSKNTFVLLDRTVKDLRMGAYVSAFWCWILTAAKIKVPLSTLIGQTEKMPCIGQPQSQMT